ncbi:hypothetical protein PC9H_002226 [Pleurotus ostreatus]|uniref:Uncharacterized protein n=1 Tax=Pleurotus ostreatus TaxID=5322 RepID=A0A8H6ZI49_PLEOS|nr:uncharacterized protein PC9H_002226 [Pleurotus ostreatus]KAF7419635.1 hypothetical protein PC9H_002226 [Pleurotus ostreatus]
MQPGSHMYAKMTSPTEGGCDRSPSRFVKGLHSPYVKPDSKRSSTLISCPYDHQCKSTAPDFAALMSHGVCTHGVFDSFLCPFCPFSIDNPEALVHHGIMKHGFYPRSHPSCIDLPCSDSTRTTYRARRMPDRSDYLEDRVLSDHLSSDNPTLSWRPSLDYAAEGRLRNTHSRTGHRERNPLRSVKKHRSHSKDSSNTTPSPSPSPSPSRSPLNLDLSYDYTPPVDLTASALYRSLLAPFVEPEPYPMPDYAEDTVIYPLEMPEFDDDVFGRSCADDL